MMTDTNSTSKSKRLEPKIVQVGCPEEFHIGTKMVCLISAQEGVVTRVIRKGPDTIVDFTLEDGSESTCIFGYGWPAPVIGILLEPKKQD